MNSRATAQFSLFFFLSVSSYSFANTTPNLTLGQADLSQDVTISRVSPGVRYIQINRGYLSERDFYTLSTSVMTLESAANLSKSLLNQGFNARIETVNTKLISATEQKYLVRFGEFIDVKRAQQVADSLRNKGFKLAVRHTAEDGNSTSGPFAMSILDIDLAKFSGRLISALGNGSISGRQTTSDIAGHNRAVAAVNGGFFAWNEQVGVEGDLAGLSIIDGKLVSEAATGRPAVLLKNTNEGVKAEFFTSVSSQTQVSFGKNEVNVDGLNRKAGVLLNCGASLQNNFAKPVHDHLCQPANEIILYTPDFGGKVTVSSGFVVIANNGVVEQDYSILSETTLDVPTDGFLLHFSDKPLIAINKGQTFNVQNKVIADGQELVLGQGEYMINGGPTLLVNSKRSVKYRQQQGWSLDTVKSGQGSADENDGIAQTQSDNKRLPFHYAWIDRRHPRTAIGITSDRHLLLVTVYGRQPGYSAGANIDDMEQLMFDLGAKQAMNLDGGGSSMMLVNGQKTGTSSDSTGERPVGDAILILP